MFKNEMKGLYHLCLIISRPY